MPAPDIIHHLVETFEEQKETLKAPSFNETQVRIQFIDPMFKALGWDIDNSQGFAEAYKDVVHEDKVLIGKTQKAPDYSFRVGGTRKFFVEAKKPAVSINLDPKPAFQVRRYGWSADLPICIVTDFEEFAVYDTSIKPNETDTPKKARLFYWTYDEYIEKWDEIAALFSKEAILKGAFDRYSKKKRKGTETVDKAFLEEIEGWRLALAKNLHKNNPSLTMADLNSAVQTIIDRIVFLRICEDRGIEPEDRLKKLGNKKNVYKGLVQQFKDADAKYNSGLFHFAEERGRKTDVDTLTPTLQIEDYILKEIFETLYYPNPYEFSVLPPDILGQVYERFLGKVITLDEHGVEIEEKPEVRKAGGVYYTPSYIVDYIVKHTVGELLKDKTPAQAEKLRIVDPACGSGSFLIVAYQYLLDWHLDYYVKNQGKKGTKDKVYRSDTGVWKLSIGERKRILLDNIYGVDIDKQAVEVTKLSLLLKVLEGETQDSVSNQMNMFKERALPDLGNNIQCGNSLIGSDFYAQDNLPDLTDEEHQRLNVFDWEDAFPHVFEAGGFDAVIGNPPYIFARDDGFKSYEKTYFYKKFQEQNYQLNTYTMFIEHGKNLMCKGGKFGYIVPNNWLTIGSLKDFRDYVLGNTGNLLVVNYFYKVFDGANVDTCTLIFEKNKPTQATLYASHKPEILEIIDECPQKNLLKKEVINFNKVSSEVSSVLEKMNDYPVLSDFSTVKSGLKAYEVGKGTPVQTKDMKKKRTYHSHIQETSAYRPYLEGKDVKRYQLDWSGLWLKYGDNLAAPRKSDLFEGERILVRQIPSKPPYSVHAALTDGNFINDINSMIIKPDSTNRVKVILGLLNSKIMTFWFNATYQKLQRGIFPQFKVNELAKFPMALNAPQAAKIAAKVDELMALMEQGTKDRITEARIKGLNNQLDTLAYQAYGLTEDEIRVVEGSV